MLNKLHAIKWPKGYEPGLSDNFVSNEVIIPGYSTKEGWEYIINTNEWLKYYSNVSNIHFYDHQLPYLQSNTRFRFQTFEFIVEAEIIEFQEPTSDAPGRIAWHGWCEGEADSRLDVHHAFLFESYPNNCLRILTQETQNGVPAKEMAKEVPNPMLNAHQAWLDGIVSRLLSNKYNIN